ncbi:uracil phosphoribosyltransferase [Flocculibacter collagenilyticus]|uniref:uracil phosphoribosyltransferase n=1 Tax=Flocculibacter collagenilyticus TaxID=2744479 RepID=UPI0018F399FD|nr:uracil phosphoribosyltransferase [Flocculibacter collagenilyticus]
MSQFSELTHPLIQHKLTEMRDKHTPKKLFNQNLFEITQLMTYAVTQDLPLQTTTVTTPLCDYEAPTLLDDNIVIVPILRAGLGMSHAVEALIPTASIGCIGVYRDEETKRPVEYLIKLPDLTNKQIIVTDPMLATGHSAAYAIKLLVERGATEQNIRLMTLVACPEGLQVIAEAFPQVHTYTAALDSHLDENAYIVPGLGDAGDRLFGTEH